MPRSNPDPDPSPNHIRLEYLKGLVPKLWFYEREPAEYFEDRDDFISFLDLYCQQAVKRSPNEELLDESFQTRVLAHLKGQFPASPGWATFEEAARYVNCRVCAGTTRKPCCGNLNTDPNVVADPGYCISPLYTLFEISREFARRLYKEYARDYGVYLHTRHVEITPERPKMHDIPVNYYVIGNTTLIGADSAVMLDLNYDKFDAETFRAVLYVLFHECICHAFQGSVNEENLRTGCGADDSFAEGWMDWVAVELLQEFLRGEVGGSEDLLDGLRYAAEMARIGSHFHNQRRNWRSNPRSAYALVHHRGYVTAGCVVNLLEDIGIPDYYRVFRNLSFQINAMPITRMDRKRFMQNLTLDFAPYCFARSRDTILPSLSREFEKYAADGDAKRLVESISQRRQGVGR